MTGSDVLTNAAMASRSRGARGSTYTTTDYSASQDPGESDGCEQTEAASHHEQFVCNWKGDMTGSGQTGRQDGEADPSAKAQMPAEARRRRARPVGRHPGRGAIQEPQDSYIWTGAARQRRQEDSLGVDTGLDGAIESLRRALGAASASVGLEVHVRPLDPPRVPDALHMWDQAGKHKYCPQHLEVILRIDRAPNDRLSVDGWFVTWKWADQVDLRARGWEGDPYPDECHWEIDLGNRSALALLLGDLRAALFAIGAQAGTRISFDVIRGAGSPTVAADEAWVDGASAGDLYTRLVALAGERGGSVAVALTTRPGAVIRLEVRPRGDSLVVTGRLTAVREGVAKALRNASWRQDRDERHLRRSWRLPGTGEAMIPRDRLFADLGHALTALAGESPGGDLSVRLETREAEVEWKGQGSQYANGFGGWLAGGAVTIFAGFVLGVAGIGLPAWWTDTFQRGSDTGLGEFMLLLLAFVCAGLAAMAAAALVMWLADRVRARYGPASIIAEVTAAAVTVMCFVALGLAGDSWGLVPASTFILGSFAIFLLLLARGLRRIAGQH